MGDTRVRLATSQGQVVWATEVTNHEAVFRFHWLSASLHQGVVFTPCLEWVGVVGLHVDPLEVTQVGLRVELSAGTLR